VLDPGTREPYLASAAELAALGHPEARGQQLYRVGADLFQKSGGYKGRTGVYELVALDESLRQAIHDKAGELELERIARRAGPGILEDGWRKAVAGITSVEEVLKVTRED